MNKRLQGFAAGALVATVALGASSGFAKEAAEQITAVYRDIKLVVDGVLVEPKDANGDSVEPFIYNGTTYLPVRAVATAFKKDVAWDGEENTVYLGGEVEKPAKQLELWSRSYIDCSDISKLKTYQEKGVGYIRCNCEKGGTESNGKYYRTYFTTYPTNTLAKTVSGSYYISGRDDVEGRLKILDSNGKALYTSPIMRTSTAPVEFEVNVEKTIAIEFVFEQTSPDSSYRCENYQFIENPIIVSSDY